MIRLLLLRHAPTAWNAEHRMQGRADQPLSAAGRALAATWRLPAAVAAAWCSPLARARETAAILGLAATPAEPLVEMDWGGWEGMTIDELRQQPEFLAAEGRGLDFQPPGGESPRQVQARLLPWIAGLAGDSIAVTHKGVIRAAYAAATGWDMLGKPPHRSDWRALAFAWDGRRLHLTEPQVALCG